MLSILMRAYTVRTPHVELKGSRKKATGLVHDFREKGHFLYRRFKCESKDTDSVYCTPLTDHKVNCRLPACHSSFPIPPGLGAGGVVYGRRVGLSHPRLSLSCAICAANPRWAEGITRLEGGGAFRRYWVNTAPCSRTS